jgi:DNA-binding MarR family transcriptional regulator
MRKRVLYQLPDIGYQEADMDSLNEKELSAGKPILERMSRMKAVMQGFRNRLDEELQPLGITTAQLKMLWSIAENPEISGAKVARLCSVTPQSGQAMIAMMEAHGWVQRRPSEASHRVLVAELTGKGRRVLVKARGIAEALDCSLWMGIGEKELAGMDATLKAVVERLQQ